MSMDTEVIITDITRKFRISIFSKDFMALPVVFMMHLIMVLMIYQNKKVLMVIQNVVIEVFVVDEDVVDNEVEIQKMKSLFLSH
jgi:hypothetical protein